MFTPIKNFITYIQKNANFGSNTTSASSEENKKQTMETNDKLNLQIAENGQNFEEGGNLTTTDGTKSINGGLSSVMASSLTSETNTESNSARSSLNGNMDSLRVDSEEYEDDDDIESQIESSIMIKKPVKDGSNKNSEILEVKKSPDRSIVISHDCGPRSMVVASPIDDELDDFRHAPSEVITSSPLNNHGDGEVEIISSSNDKNKSSCKVMLESSNGHHSQVEEEEVEYNTCDRNGKDNTQDSIIISDSSGSEKLNGSDGKIVLIDSEFEDVEERVETLYSVSADEVDIDEEDDSDETFLDMDQFPDGEVIVISENTEDNTDIMPIESSDAANTSDDPLAIACDEVEAFAADKITALQELHLLNNSANSQDEDTTTTTTTADDEILWLRSDKLITTTATAVKRSNEQPTCSKNAILILSNGQNAATPEKEERNGEGSDSGLGSETSALHTTNTSIVDTSHLNMTSSVVTTPVTSPNSRLPPKTKEKDISSEVIKTTPTKPLRSNLKRRLEVDHDDVVDTLRNIATSSTSTSSMGGNANKKPKRSINFDTVQVYYFPRQQGFSCVPSAGGCTLGMGARHVGFKTLTLAEHAAELRRAHRMQLQEINPRGSSSDDSEESEEDYLSEGSGSDLDGESNGFLQPVSPKQRRTILKAAGIRKIDPSEKAECRDIRNSREVCGCSCREFCDPETCACSQSGIKCQVDRDMFPCGCTRDACGNTIGRVEFNPARVRTHFIHTLMRLEMENRQQQNPYTPAGAVIPTATVNSSSYYQSHLQPQSNYSSGYASPAYNPGADMHQQNAANTFYHHQQPTTSTSALYGGGGGGTSLEMSHAASSSTASYGMDNMDSSGIFNGAGSNVTPSYGELMPVASYHPHHTMNYGNVQETQMSGYNSYNNNNTTPYINTNVSTNLNNTPTSYSSCSVPSLPPYGTATTTEASATYHHSVGSLTTLGTTTTAQSYVKAGAETTTPPMYNDDVGTSFIDLTTPLASSSRLTQQINDLLENNRNNSTALVAVTQSTDETGSSAKNAGVAHLNGICEVGANPAATLSSNQAETTSLNTPPMEEVNKTCVYDNLQTAMPPLKPAPIVVEDIIEAGPEKLPAPPPPPASRQVLTPAPSLEEQKHQPETPVSMDNATNDICTTSTTTANTEPMINLATAVVSTAEKPEEEVKELEEEKMDTTGTTTETSAESNDINVTTETTTAEIENVDESPAAAAASPADITPSPTSTIEVAVAVGN